LLIAGALEPITAAAIAAAAIFEPAVAETALVAAAVAEIALVAVAALERIPDAAGVRLAARTPRQVPCLRREQSSLPAPGRCCSCPYLLRTCLQDPQGNTIGLHRPQRQHVALSQLQSGASSRA
jgi:hypothetical protein